MEERYFNANTAGNGVTIKIENDNMAPCFIFDGTRTFLETLELNIVVVTMYFCACLSVYYSFPQFTKISCSN